MDAADRQLLEATVREAVTDAVVSGGDATVVDKVLTDLGWLEMLDAEPRAATEIVFTVLGVTNAAASALDDIVAAALGSAVGAGVAVVLPEAGSWAAPGRIEDGVVRAVGVATHRVTSADQVVVVAGDASGVIAVTAPCTVVDA